MAMEEKVKLKWNIKRNWDKKKVEFEMEYKRNGNGKEGKS